MEGKIYLSMKMENGQSLEFIWYVWGDELTVWQQWRLRLVLGAKPGSLSQSGGGLECHANPRMLAS